MITADTQVLLNKPYCEISYDSAKKVIVAQWKGFLTLDQTKEGCELMNEFIKKHEVKNHLSDHTHLKVLSKSVQDYLTGEWFAKVESLGLTKIAVKVAEDVFAQATVKKVNTQQKYGNMTIDTFGSYPAAYEWLQK
jgi:hypothetical protein